jgi:NTP pyrophosphatase (non-canonical NTP hydrolase)
MLNDMQMSSLRRVQDLCERTAIYPNRDSAGGIAYCALGLSGEAGEVAEEVKKMIRNDDARLSPERRDRIMMELGDVVWYISNMACEIDAGLDECVEMMLNKLDERRMTGGLKHE